MSGMQNIAYHSIISEDVYLLTAALATADSVLI